MRFKQALNLFLVLFALTITKAEATNNSTSTTVESNRMKNRAGAYLGLLGDPYPTLVGVNLAYNVFDFMRVSAGFGKISASASFGSTEVSSSATTIGGTVRFMVPNWSLTPTAGLGFSHVSISDDAGVTVSVKNFTESASHLYGNFGFDWQSSGGFNVGAGYNYSFKSGIGGAVYVNLGWYFDFI
jgi:hypothetical protein